MTTAAAGVLDRLSSLADETRTRILLLLEGSELTVSELCRVIQLPQSTVSRHLRILFQDGWLSVRSEGTSRHYRLSRRLDPGARRIWGVVREELSATSAARTDRIRAGSVLEARAERSKAFFSSEAGRWDLLREELFGRRADLQLLAGFVNETEVVGDLGCGTGHLARLLAPFAKRVIALDRSDEMLEIARVRLSECPNVDLRRGELESLPVADGSLDVAILSLVLHYVLEPVQALKEVHRTLRPRGRILILDMQRHDRAEFREEMGHVWLGFSPEELEDWLDKAGFASQRRLDLPPDSDADGPLLFSLRADRAGDEPDALTSTHEPQYSGNQS